MTEAAKRASPAGAFRPGVASPSARPEGAVAPPAQRHRLARVSVLPPEAAPVQREQSPEADDEEETLQGKLADAPDAAPPAQDERSAGVSGLPAPLKTGVENLSGLSMDGVRVHYNSSKPAQLQALAYAQGREIHLAPGQERHLPHEAWHVAQQAQGRVRPTRQMKAGIPVNDDRALEHEADVMGQKAAAGTAQLQDGPDGVNATQGKLDVSQRMTPEDEEEPVQGAFTSAAPARPIQLQSGLLTIPGKRKPESYLGWGGVRIGKELVSKAAGLKRGVGSMLGGAGRMLGFDLPGTYPNVTVAGMSIELQAALALAQADDDTVPGWLVAGQRRPNGGAYAPGLAGHGHPGYTTDHRKQYRAKFGSQYWNEDGKLPGVRGAGGYREYYAQPAAGACVGPWGSNRILQQTNDPTGTYWWATNDHYTSFRYIKDA